MPTNYTYDWATQSWVPDNGGTSTPAPYQSDPVVSGAGAPSGSTSGASTGYAPQAGYGYDLLDRAKQDQEDLYNLQQKHQLELKDLDQRFKTFNDQRDSQLKLMLQQGLINNEQYKQAKELAQQESEFARTLAFNQMKEGHDYELQKASEGRQERALQAQLSANPTDWVAYEFYKRGLGSPGAANMAANATGAAPSPGQAGSAGTGSGGTSGSAYDPAHPTMLGGGAYAPAPPAYNNNSIQTLATSLFDQNKPAYTPGLAGTGAFGTQINAPNTISREQMNNMSPTEQSMLAGLLKAGINIGGQQVSISPEDYMKEQQQSQVPSLDESIGQYAARSAQQVQYT